MPKSGWKTVSIRETVLADLEKIYNADQNRPKNVKFHAFLDNLLQEVVDHEEKLRTYGPFLELIGKRDNHIHLYDHMKKANVNVYVDEGKKRLMCEDDKTPDCVHVGFCLAIREVYDILVERGFRTPKKGK